MTSFLSPEALLVSILREGVPVKERLAEGRANLPYLRISEADAPVKLWLALWLLLYTWL